MTYESAQREYGRLVVNPWDSPTLQIFHCKVKEVGHWHLGNARGRIARRMVKRAEKLRRRALSGARLLSLTKRADQAVELDHKLRLTDTRGRLLASGLAVRLLSCPHAPTHHRKFRDHKLFADSETVHVGKVGEWTDRTRANAADRSLDGSA